MKMGRGRRIEDEFEETLSLIDLPIKPSSDRQPRSSNFMFQKEDVQNRACLKTEESEFNFGSLTGSTSTRMEMSSADELFLHGQILPLRLSVDSKMSRVANPGRPDSLGHCRSSSIEFTSSRSSSYSSTSSRSVNNVSKTTPYQPRIRNQFHAHPSPTPRIRAANVKQSSSGRCRKSSVWDTFRLGPVQAPGIELKDLKSRNPHSLKTRSFINKSDNLINHNPTSKASLKQRMFTFRLGGCRCSADSVENVQSRIVIIQSVGMERKRWSDFKESEIAEELKRKIEEARRRMRKNKQAEETREGFPSRRTFEWLKQLSVEDDANQDLNIN